MFKVEPSLQEILRPNANDEVIISEDDEKYGPRLYLTDVNPYLQRKKMKKEDGGSKKPKVMKQRPQKAANLFQELKRDMSMLTYPKPKLRQTTLAIKKPEKTKCKVMLLKSEERDKMTVMNELNNNELDNI